MQSTDRPQVRDLIEMLQRFDLKARVCGREFEITGANKSDDCLVYLETDSNEAVKDWEQKVSDLESECATLEDDNADISKEKNKLETALIEIKRMAQDHPEKLAKFILEGEE